MSHPRPIVPSSPASEKEERDAVDLITDSMFAVDFLQIASHLAFSEDGDRMSVKQLYELWRSRNQRPERALPFNPGSILAFLYLGILFPKEKSDWFDLVPDEALSTSDPAWGLQAATVVAPKRSNPTVKYCVRRIRNALGHASPVYNVPESLPPGGNVFEAVRVTFRDENVRDPDDTFEIALSVLQCLSLARKFRSVVHQHVRTMYGL
jgi:hypothetical protein